MEITGQGLAVAAFFLIGGRLAIFYLERLDAKAATGPGAERRAIAASRSRARGHLWLLGTLLGTLFALVFAVAPGGPPVWATLAIVAALAAAAAFCARQMVRAYGASRRAD